MPPAVGENGGLARGNGLDGVVRDMAWRRSIELCNARARDGLTHYDPVTVPPDDEDKAGCSYRSRRSR